MKNPFLQLIYPTGDIPTNYITMSSEMELILCSCDNYISVWNFSNMKYLGYCKTNDM